MRKTPIVLLFLFFAPLVLWAQEEQTAPILNSRDSLLLVIDDGKKFILHTVKPKQTLFSLSKFYSIGLESLYEFNPGFSTSPTLRVGQKVKIPIPNKAIKRYKSSGFIPSEHVSIYYIVQQGDNLYQICKRHFDMPVDSIAKRNRLKNNNIKPGQRIQMGWMGVEGIHPEWRPVQVVTESDVLKSRYKDGKRLRKETESQGVCFWQKDSKEKGSLYALHRLANIGSIIRVNNPMGNRTVYAKVIGRIPDGYERNVEVILSPEAARKLGARDPRFFVKTTFLK